MKKEYIALELEKELLGKEVLRDELMSLLKSKDISWACFKKYVKVERLEKEELIELSLEEVVRLLNECSCVKKYVKVERLEKEEAVELSLEEVVRLLNECSRWGEYYNSESSEYRVIDDKPCEVIRHSYIKVL